MAPFSRQGYMRRLLFLLLVVVTGLCCECASLSHPYVTSSRGGDDSMNRFGKWKSAVPTYAVNWPEHQGTVEDLVEANSAGVYIEKHLLASWAAAAASDADQDEFNHLHAINNEIKYFKSNPCAPGRDCTHYEKAGYVFNSMTL